MGHDHHELPKIPDPSIYKIEDSERCKKLQARLAEKGLRDPWMRNYVWRFTLDKNVRFRRFILLQFFTHGWQYWVPLVGLTIAVEKFLGIDYHGNSHDHDHSKTGEYH